MPKLIIPRSNEKEKAIFEKLNIQLIESLSVEEFENTVINYLNTHNVLNLATCKNNEPRSTSLEYFNNGLIVYVLSEGGGKIANLKANSKVCYTIHDPYDTMQDYFGAIGLQVWGTASFFKKNDNPEKAADIMTYSRSAEALKKHGLEQAASTVNFNVITIEPEKIKYLDLRQGFRNVTWAK